MHPKKIAMGQWSKQRLINLDFAHFILRTIIKYLCRTFNDQSMIGSMLLIQAARGTALVQEGLKSFQGGFRLYPPRHSILRIYVRTNCRLNIHKKQDCPNVKRKYRKRFEIAFWTTGLRFLDQVYCHVDST